MYTEIHTGNENRNSSCQYSYTSPVLVSQMRELTYIYIYMHIHTCIYTYMYECIKNWISVEVVCVCSQEHS